MVYYRCFLFTTPANMRSLASCDFVHSAYTMTLLYLSTRVENQIAPKIPHFRVNQQHSNTVHFLYIQLQFKLRLFVQIWPTCRKYFQKSSNLTTKRVVRKDLFCATGSTSVLLPSQCCSSCHYTNVYSAVSVIEEFGVLCTRLYVIVVLLVLLHRKVWSMRRYSEKSKNVKINK